MSSNTYWQPQNNQNRPTLPTNRSGLPGNSLNRQNPPSGQLPSGQLPPYPPNSPMRPGQPGPQMPPPNYQGNGQGFMARPVEMVRRWSNKMNAMRRPGPPVSQGSPVRYAAPMRPMPRTVRPVQELPEPWRRSRVQRINHLRKRRRERIMSSRPGMRRTLTIAISVLAAFLVIGVSSTASYAYNYYQSELPQVQNLSNLRIAQSTHIYDRHGTLLYTLYSNGDWGESGRSTPISYKFLPGVLQDAQTAAEDPTFWTNEGIDPQGMLRALTQLTSSGGQIQSGGSTMTQQLIKNLSGQNQDTFQRKASEAVLAIGLTRQYPKWKIMEMYFNDSPYGAQEQGVESAVEDYFGLKPQCDINHNCTPAIAYLDRDLTKCKNSKNQETCAEDPMLALARAVLLAGIPQNPTRFDPSVSAENFQDVLANRVPYVLTQMIADNAHLNIGLGSDFKDLGPITKAMEPEVESMIQKMKIIGFHQTMLAPHFVQWVIDTLSNQLGHDQDLDQNGRSIPGYNLLLTGGFNIYTTLDLPLEQFIEKDVKHNLRDPVYQEFLRTWGPLDTMYNVNDAAVVVENAKTGEILAMDGSADYSNTKNVKIAGQVNAALSARQPGSSIKPFVYAAAFEKGWFPGIKLIDDKTNFPDGGTPYIPHDYGGLNSYHPSYDTNIRISLSNSFNIPAVKALMFAGFNNVVDMARRLGITALDDDVATYNSLHPKAPNTLPQLFGPSLALGTPGIPLYQMVGAYQVFADNGQHVPYHNILNIYDNYGHDLYHYDTAHPQSIQVLSPQIAYLLNSMLSDNAARQRYEFGGIDTLTMGPWAPDRPVAAKTGTTDGNLDNWTIGYSSSVVVGVWAGNADGNDQMTGVIGVTGAGPIWHDVITYLSGQTQLGMHTDHVYPTDPFPIPSGVVQSNVSSSTGLEGSGDYDWMIQGEQPQQAGIATPACPTDPKKPKTPDTCPVN